MKRVDFYDQGRTAVALVMIAGREQQLVCDLPGEIARGRMWERGRSPPNVRDVKLDAATILHQPASERAFDTARFARLFVSIFYICCFFNGWRIPLAATFWAEVTA